MNEHDDHEIVDVLARDFPNVFEQILEYLDNLGQYGTLGGSIPPYPQLQFCQRFKLNKMKEIIIKIYYSICEDTGEKIYDTELMQKDFSDKLIKLTNKIN